MLFLKFQSLRFQIIQMIQLFQKNQWIKFLFVIQSTRKYIRNFKYLIFLKPSQYQKEKLYSVLSDIIGKNQNKLQMYWLNNQGMVNLAKNQIQLNLIVPININYSLLTKQISKNISMDALNAINALCYHMSKWINQFQVVKLVRFKFAINAPMKTFSYDSNVLKLLFFIFFVFLINWLQLNSDQKNDIILWLTQFLYFLIKILQVKINITQIYLITVHLSMIETHQSQQQIHQDIGFDKVQPFELIYQDISVFATIEAQFQQEEKTIKRKVQKNILKSCSGKFQPYSFTAILGPSGSGKTTMLNLLSGRLLSDNLTIRGKLKVNGKQTDNINQYKNYLGYVMQQDYMLPTFTPFEVFKFVTDIRLSHKSEEEKVEMVQKVINFLGLGRCRDTYVGDNRIRGISGGQKKRTSIGLQLLTNPSIIFLDEPTTGLDSTTALNLMTFLNKLAKTGRTVVSTIHQPSSQIFGEFDKMLLIVDGNTVYHGGARQSTHYFSKVGMSVPIHSNPTDHYMKIMNKEGIMLQYIEQEKQFTEDQITTQFQQKVNLLVHTYKTSNLDIQNKYIDQFHITKDQYQSSWFTQFYYILKRNWINQFRQPLDVILKIVQSIFFAIICIILYVDKAKSQTSYIQNFRGVSFFVIMNTGFSYVFSSVNLFNFERPIFIRERLSNTYQTSAYFWGRSLAVLPVETFTPFLFLVICYFAVNLNNSGISFLYAFISVQGTAWMASSYGLVLSTLFSDAAVVMALVPALIIPLLLVGGFFAPLSEVPKFYYIFQYISMFKYGFQTFVQSQFQSGQLLINGVDQGNPKVLLQEKFGFTESYGLSIGLLFGIGLVLRGLALFIMYKISNPKVMKLSVPLQKLPDSQTKQIQVQNHSS